MQSGFWRSHLVFELKEYCMRIGRKLRTERIRTSDAHSLFYGLSNTIFFLTQKLGVTAKNRFHF